MLPIQSSPSGNSKALSRRLVCKTALYMCQTILLMGGALVHVHCSLVTQHMYPGCINTGQILDWPEGTVLKSCQAFHIAEMLQLVLRILVCHSTSTSNEPPSTVSAAPFHQSIRSVELPLTAQLIPPYTYLFTTISPITQSSPDSLSLSKFWGQIVDSHLSVTWLHHCFPHSQHEAIQCLHMHRILKQVFRVKKNSWGCRPNSKYLLPSAAALSLMIGNT